MARACRPRPCPPPAAAPAGNRRHEELDSEVYEDLPVRVVEVEVPPRHMEGAVREEQGRVQSVPESAEAPAMSPAVATRPGVGVKPLPPAAPPNSTVPGSPVPRAEPPRVAVDVRA